MELFYDLHIHTGLSPCGDLDMTPNNIVNMAGLKGLDVIAITDHNSCGNCKAVLEAGARINPELIIIPGMEVETSEEIHCICLFANITVALEFDEFIKANSFNIKNRSDIYGRQALYNSNDKEIGEHKNLLLTATKIDLYSMVKEVKARSGAIFPAHVDRGSYSVISSLGFVPDDLDISFVEFSKNIVPEEFAAKNKNHLLREFEFLQSSDAHYLWDICEKNRTINVKNRSAKAVIEYLRGTNNET